jgi:hypothetical protein
MTIAEIISREEDHTIRLYKHGLFWVAYEKSAYAIHKITNYKATQKYIKNMREYVVCLGFPDSALGKMLGDKTFSILENTEKYKSLLSPYTIDKGEFEKWKKLVALSKSKENRKDTNSAEEAIKNFSLETKTPIEAFLFIRELQKRI